MKIRGYCLFFVAALCLLLSGCELKDYPTYTYQLSNKLGERYLINYCEQTGYPDNSTRVKIFKEKEKIGDYDGGAYTGCDSYIPSQIMLIASKDKVDYYYMKSQFGEYIIADGVLDVKMNFNMIRIGVQPNELNDMDKRSYSKLAAAVRNAVTADEAKKRFSACGYSSDSFIAFYNYKIRTEK